jgi:hypothetical protein
LRHKRINPLLEQGLAPGDLNQNSGVFIKRGKYPADGVGLMLSFVCIAGIAVRAAQVAAGEADKKTGIPGIGGFSLDTIKKLADF